MTYKKDYWKNATEEQRERWRAGQREYVRKRRARLDAEKKCRDCTKPKGKSHYSLLCNDCGLKQAENKSRVRSIIAHSAFPETTENVPTTPLVQKGLDLLKTNPPKWWKPSHTRRPFVQATRPGRTGEDSGDSPGS